MAAQDIVSQAVPSAITLGLADDGFVLRLEVDSNVVGAAVDLGSGFGNALRLGDAPTVSVTVVSKSFTATGAASTETVTLYGTEVLRKPFPNEAQQSEGSTIGGAYVDIVLSDAVYAKDKAGAGNSGTDPLVTVTAGAIRNDGGLGELSNALAGGPVTNNSSLAYLAPIAQWSDTFGDGRRVDADFKVAASARHIHGVRMTRFTTQVGLFQIDDQKVTEESSHEFTRTGYFASWYEATVPIAGASQGSAPTSRLRVYPIRGDVIFDSASPPVAGPAHGFESITNKCDKNDLLRVYAYVSASGTASGTNSATEATAAADPWDTIDNALSATPTPTDVVVDSTGAFEVQYSGAALGDIGWARVIRKGAAGSAATLTRTTSIRTYKMPHLKLDGFEITGTSWFDGENTNRLWLDNCWGNPGGGVTVGLHYRSVLTRLTNSRMTPVDKDYLSQFSGYVMAIRGEGVLEDGSVIGSHLMTCWYRATGCRLTMSRSEISTANPGGSSDGCFYESSMFSTGEDEKMTAYGGSYAYSRGVSFCGTLVERAFGAEGSSTLAHFSADSDTMTIAGFLVAHCSFFGQRTNWMYNDAAVAVLKNRSVLFGVAASLINTKHDVFSADGNLTGAWSQLYGVGHGGNAYDALSSSSFDFEFAGLGTKYVDPGDVGWATIGDLVLTADHSDAGDAAGGGVPADYTPAEGSPLKDALPAGRRLMRFDMLGTEIRTDGTGSIGAVQVVSNPVRGSRGLHAIEQGAV